MKDPNVSRNRTFSPERDRQDTLKDHSDNYPATVVVHWPTGPVNCCQEHARQLFALNEVLGGHLVQTHAEEGAQCSNCKNEAEKHNETA